MKRRCIFSVALVVAIATLLAATLVSCKPKKPEEKPTIDMEAYLKESDEVYDKVLGEYRTALDAAKAEKLDVNQRFAKMAIAEAKLLEACVYVPTTCRGGTYAISRVAPNTTTNVMYGNDQDRNHQLIIATTPISNEDRETMKAKYGELKNEENPAKAYENYLKETWIGEGKPYARKTTYSAHYTSDPQTWDVLATFRQPDSAAIVNTFDGLMEYDSYGFLQPALAEKEPDTSEDGLKYTFTIKKGIKWATMQGKAYAEVTADDFVAGFQHMLDAKQGPQQLVDGLIVNATEYMAGEAEWADVGVKAEGNKLTYTLVAPTAHFKTMLGYNPFAPMNRSFYESKGGKFGKDFDSASEDYDYGKKPESILYCGPYLVKESTEKKKIAFVKNDLYWNKDNINVDAIDWEYNDIKDPLKGYNDMIAGTIDGCGLNEQALAKAKQETSIDKTNNNFEKYHYITKTDSTAFGGFMNVNRKAFVNFDDETKCRSGQTAIRRERTKKAMQNVHFRRALAFAFDRAAYNEMAVGEDLRETSLVNSYTPGIFVSLGKDTKVQMNGKEKTYKSGTLYGEIVQDQIDADGVKIKAWDPQREGVGSSSGFDGWYNPENAKAELEIALRELEEQGAFKPTEGMTEEERDEVSADKIIHIDYPYAEQDHLGSMQAHAFAQSIMKTLDYKVMVQLVNSTVYNPDLLNAGFYCEAGYQCNYDVYTVAGWGPDYGDPLTYLHTMEPEDGEMVHCLGLY